MQVVLRFWLRVFYFKGRETPFEGEQYRTQDWNGEEKETFPPVSVKTRMKTCSYPWQNLLRYSRSSSVTRHQVWMRFALILRLVVVLILKDGDRRVCSSNWGITLFSLQRKVYSRVLQRGSDRLSNPRFRRSNAVSLLDMEQWTSSLTLWVFWGGHMDEKAYDCVS